MRLRSPPAVGGSLGSKPSVVWMGLATAEKVTDTIGGRNKKSDRPVCHFFALLIPIFLHRHGMHLHQLRLGDLLDTSSKVVRPGQLSRSAPVCLSPERVVTPPSYLRRSCSVASAIDRPAASLLVHKSTCAPLRVQILLVT